MCQEKRSISSFQMLCPGYVIAMYLHHLQWPLRWLSPFKYFIEWSGFICHLQSAMSIYTLDRKGKKTSLTDYLKAVKTASKYSKRYWWMEQWQLTYIDEQPAIIRHAVADIREEVLDDCREIKDDVPVAYKCRIKNCYRDFTFSSLEALVQHTNETHANVKWTKDKPSK